jgi:hypothetical protein
MRISMLAAACATLALCMPAFSANGGVENWQGSLKADPRKAYADQYQEAVKKYYLNALAAHVPSARSQAAFVPPTGPVPRNVAGDYFNEMVAGDGGEHWTLEQMPLRVYIGHGGPGYRSNFPDLFTAAMNEWSKASGGKIRWAQVSSPEAANIVVNWSANASSAPGEAGNTRIEHGYTADGGRCISFAEIALVPTHAGATYSDAEMHKICLHEIGHALGLRHSSTMGDIMYFQSNGAQISALGPRDVSTIRRLYTTAQ